MDKKFEIIDEGGERIVYVRPISVTELPIEVRDKLVGLDRLYAVHSVTGERLALVTDRWMAFELARQNDATALSVH